MAKVGLVMIVKDEEHVIRRALQSSLPFVSTYVVVDTGSTDETMRLIQEFYEENKVSGYLEQRPWVNLGHNRTEALQLCQGRMNWAIMLDADDTLEGDVPDPKVWDLSNGVDGYNITLKDASYIYPRVQCFRIASGWKYVGAVHDCAVCTKPNAIVGFLEPTIWMVASREGSRNTDPLKYAKDVALLEKEYQNDPTNTRTVFYLGQSCKDAKMPDEAAKWYLKRTQMWGWAQEIYMSYYNLIKLCQDPVQQIEYGWKALEACPHRLEVTHALMESRRLCQLPFLQQVYAMAMVATAHAHQPDDLFAMPWIYDWGFDFELGILAYWTGHYAISYEVSRRALKTCPSEYRDQIVQNVEFARVKRSS